MKLPIIGITSRIGDNNICKVPENIINYIKNNNGIPLIIPDLDNNSLEKIISIFDGFIIPGGNTFTKTDEYVINYAIDNDYPLIGICAGMQALGCIKYFDTENSDHTVPTNSSINHHNTDQQYVHEIIINDGLLKKILVKDKIEVNSRHYCKIENDDTFVVDAISTDNIIEAIHIDNKKMIIGLQWHPEDLDDDNSKRLFKYFINKCQDKEK